MTKFLDKKFSVYSGSGEKYRDNWDAIFSKKPYTEPAAAKAVPMYESDDYEARARTWIGHRPHSTIDTVALTALLRTVADEARREERAACEAACREVAGESRTILGWGAEECADRISARGKAK